MIALRYTIDLSVFCSDLHKHSKLEIMLHEPFNYPQIYNLLSPLSVFKRIVEKLKFVFDQPSLLDELTAMCVVIFHVVISEHWLSPGEKHGFMLSIILNFLGLALFTFVTD